MIIGAGISSIRDEFISESARGYAYHTGWKATRFVLVQLEDGSLWSGARKKKPEGCRELRTVRKNCVVEGGPTAKEWTTIFALAGMAMEKAGLYIERNPITDKTPSLFRENE
jgi:hypothetical protein